MTRSKIAIIAPTIALVCGALFMLVHERDQFGGAEIVSDITPVTIEEKTFQEDAIALYGHPIQVKLDGTLSDGQKATDVISKAIPPGSETNVYETKEGWGYQVIEYGTTTIGKQTFRQKRSTGYGPEAAARTWDWKILDEYVASST